MVYGVGSKKTSSIETRRGWREVGLEKEDMITKEGRGE